MMKRIIILLLLVSLFIGCSYPIKHDNLKLYQKVETQYCVIYSQYPIDQSLSSDFDKISSNLTQFLSKTLTLNIQMGKVDIGILPLTNSVCDFSKRGTSTFAYPKRRIIYLLDIDHLPENIINKYGHAPIDYYQNGFTHELTHVLTVQNNHFSGALNMKERIANFCSFLDFTKESISISEETRKYLPANITEYFTDDKIANIKKHSLKALDSKDSLEIPLFMLYLFDTNNTVMLSQLIKSKDINDFINKSHWNMVNTTNFLYWIKSK